MPITTRNNAAAAVNSMSAGGARSAPAGGVQVIHRFDSEAFQKKDGLLGTGLGAQRDRTHQLVQHRDAKGKWQVHVQSLNEGRVNPSQYVFTSNRPVTTEDFNNPDSMLSQKAREATARLNADSNRLPDAPAPQTPPSSAAAPAKTMSTVEWLGQQGRNTIGGATAAVTSTVGMVGSLPEKAGRFAGSVGDLGQAAANMVSDGRVAKSALNPMVIDSHAKSRSGPTNAEKGMSRMQGGIDKAFGADAGSKTYKTVEVVAPLLIARKGNTGGGQGSTQRTLPGSAQTGPIAGQKLLPAARATGLEGLKPTAKASASASPDVAAPPKPVKMTSTPPQPGNPVNNPASISPVRVVKAADGSVRLGKANGQPVTLPEVVQAVANGRLTPKQLEQAKFSDVSIQGIVRDAAQLKGSTAPKTASTPVKGGKASELPADILSNVQQTMKRPDVQKRLAASNSKGEVARQNQAIKDMRANGKETASHIRPEGDGKPGSARNEPQPQRQAKPDNTTPRETQYADDTASKPQLNVKSARAETNLKPGSPASETSSSGKTQSAQPAKPQNVGGPAGAGVSRSEGAITNSTQRPVPSDDGSQPALPEGAIATFQSSTRHGPLTTEVYRSASMPESKIRANVDLLQQKNPLLYAGLPTEELVSTARKSDFFLVTTLHGTSNLWGHNAPSSTTPERAITAITERDLSAGQYGIAQGGRYAELTFVASNSALRGAGGQVVRQAEDWARSRGLDGVAFYNTDTTGGASRGFYEHMGYTLTRETAVEVKSLDPRVQQQLIDAGQFTRQAVDSGESKLPRYYFEKRFEPPTTSVDDRPVQPNTDPTPQSGQTPPQSAPARLDQRLRSVNSVESLLNTPAQTSGSSFRVDNLTRDEIAVLGTALSTPQGRKQLLNPSPNAPLQSRFLLQSLAEQANPSLVSAQARQRDQAALAEIADKPQAGEPASVKVGYRYVQDQPGGRVFREAVYTQIGQQLAVSPSVRPEPPPFTATTKQQALLYGDTVLREFNNALQRPIEPNQAQDPAQIQVLQNPDGSSGQVVQTNRAGLAERFTSLLDAAGPKVQGFNRVLNVVNPVVLAVGAGKTLFDFTQGRVVPRVNDAEAAKLFNLPKGMFVASVTLRSDVAGVPTTYTAYVALGASRDVALLPGQQGGLPRAQIGTNPFTGRRTIGLLSTFNRSAVEVGAGGNVGNNNLAVMTTNSIRVGSIAGNPLRAQINLPDRPPEAGTETSSNTSNGLSVSGGTALSGQGVQVSSLTGLRLGPAVYGRRVVVPIRYVAQASTEAQTIGLGRNFSLGGFSVARLDAKSDAYVVTVNPAFDANQIQQLIGATRQSANPAQLEGVLQQLERQGAIVRGTGR